MRKLVINQRITTRESGSFQQYLKDISKIEMFTPEEEYQCALKAEAGDLKARDELVLRNLRFVVSAAKQYSTSASQLEDLVNEGNYGITIAATGYKPSTGFKFISYAVHYIRKYMTEYLGRNAKLVRLPANKIHSISKLNQKIDQLEQRLGRFADIGDIVDAFGDDEDIEELKTLVMLGTFQFDSLDKDVSHSEGSSVTLGDMLPDHNCKPSDHLCHTAGLKFELARFMKVLKPKHQKVLIGVFGLDGEEPKSLKEVGDELGITREMVRQIKEKSLAKMKDAMKNSNLKASY